MNENSEMERLRAFINYTDTNIFLTGRAGTGKTTLLHSIVDKCPKPLVVVAPTGIAAINARGVTIHSFFQLPFSVFNPDAPLEAQKLSKAKIKIMRSVELLIIDEVSMVRSDLLDAIDAALRRHKHSSKPFGGVQLLLIGDMQQLPPVIKPFEWELMRPHYNSHYFFDSLALKKAGYLTLELSRIFRQTDREFIDILGRIRSGQADDKTLAALNARYNPIDLSVDDNIITLCSHNNIADGINDAKMAAIDSPAFTYFAEIDDKFNVPDPVDRELELKVGMRVMFVRNDTSQEKLYVNGTLGVVSDLSDERVTVVMDGDSEPINVGRQVWETVHYDVDTQTGQFVSIIDGTFTQYPLRAAWAVTIHKSQGLTFDNIALDATDSFDHGQVYVALSRCRTLGGIKLLRPLSAKAIFTSARIEAFNVDCRANVASSEALSTSAENYRRTLALSIFDFNDISAPLLGVMDVVGSELSRLYPTLHAQWVEVYGHHNEKILGVGQKFQTQLVSLFTDDNLFAERVKAAGRYFFDALQSIILAIEATTADNIDIDNKETRKVIGRRLEELYTPLGVHIAVMEWVAVNGFETLGVVTVRARAKMDEAEFKLKRKKSVKKAVEVSANASRQEVITEILREWRRDKSAQLRQPAYMILSQMGLLGIAGADPQTVDQLAQIKGIGEVFIKKYSDEILSILGDNPK